MTDETGTNDAPMKVELHLQLSLGSEPGPGGRAWDGGGQYGPPGWEREPPRRGRWVGRTLGALALVAVSVGAMTIAHRMMAAAETGALLAAARLPPVVPPATGAPRPESANAEPPATGGEGHVVGSAGSRSGVNLLVPASFLYAATVLASG
jgi:hypothetical protein